MAAYVRKQYNQSATDGFDDSTFGIKVDNSTIEISSDTVQVKNLGIVAGKIAANAVTTAKILDANVTAAKLATDAVETLKIKDLNVTVGKLAADAVETAKIKDLNVTAGKLAVDSVETAKVKDRAVTPSKLSEVPFLVTVALTGAAASTPVTIITDNAVGSGRRVRIGGMMLVVNGATAWTDDTATKVSIKDTNGAPVEAVAVAKAALTGNARINLYDATNVTLAAGVIAGTGLTVAKGIVLVADAVFAAGSDIACTVWGMIIPDPA